MVKQKVVIRVTMTDAKKRTKALTIAVKLPGVISAELEDDKVIVVGDGVDSVALTVMLRKQMGFAELCRVAPFDVKKDKEDKGGTGQKMQVWANPGAYPTYIYPSYAYQIHDPYYNQSCNIM